MQLRNGSTIWPVETSRPLPSWDLSRVRAGFPSCPGVAALAAQAIYSARQLHNSAMTPEDLQLLVTRVMPYGKYKGRLIADLPGNYLNWFAREGFPEGEIGRLLALMQEIDHNGLSSLLTPLRKARKQS